MLKIVLVDDERIVLRGMSHLIQTHYPDYEILGTFQSAPEALDFLRTEPGADVMIMDIKMPKMTGIELIQAVRQFDTRLIIIALSSYSDYDYVRQAMVGGAYDYLLKPCKSQDIHNLFCKIEKMKREERADQEVKDRQAAFSRLLSGDAQTSELYPPDSPLLAALLSLHNREEEYLYSVVQKDFMIFYSGKYDFFRFGQDILLVFSGDGVTAESTQLYFFISSLGCKKVGVDCTFELLPFSPEKLREAYQTLRRMMDFLRFNRYDAVLAYDAYQQMLARQEKARLSDYLDGKEIARLLIKRNGRRLDEAMQAAWKRAQASMLLFDPLRMRREMLQELLHILEELRECRLPAPESGDEVFGEVAGAPTFYQMFEEARRFLLDLAASFETSDDVPGYITSAVAYIEANYMNDLSLKDVADHVYLNSWYFSSQFKKYMGATMSEYLSRVRVRVAKELLRQKDLMVYQVAEMVGYGDSAYFSTVFKNQEKISPKEYQKLF